MGFEESSYVKIGTLETGGEKVKRGKLRYNSQCRELGK